MTTNANALVWIGAESPMFHYAPTRNGPLGSSWLQDSSGTICGGPSTFAVQIDGLYLSQAVFYWSASSGFTTNLGLDGELQKGQSRDGATLTAPLGSHDVRLEVACEACGVDKTFALRGLSATTVLNGINTTIDDSAAEITYSGFQTTLSSSSDVPAIRGGNFYGNTVSYTSSAGATASFTFDGTALYLFGPTGPQFGSFSLILDNQPLGPYNASTTLDTYGTLLFFTSNLPAGVHTVSLRNIDDGRLIALDYAVVVGGGSGVQVGAGNGVGVLGTTMVATVPGTTPTAVFPGQNAPNGGGNNGAAGLAIGLTLGIVAALLLLWILWRWWVWKKAGGEGPFFVALCGARHRPKKAAAKADNKFQLWPMLSYKPKYAT